MVTSRKFEARMNVVKELTAQTHKSHLNLNPGTG